MDTAVIIPLYNGKEHIRQTLRSVFAQTHPPSEIVVVDDGSTDGSCSIVEEFSGVRLSENPGTGQGAARNHGLLETDAPLVAFLDQDDLWHPSHLQHLSGLLAAHPKSPAAAASNNHFRNGSPQYKPELRGTTKYNPWQDYPANSIGEPVSVLIRRSSLKEVDAWSTRHDGCADYHLWLKLGVLGPLVESHAVTAAHRIHRESTGNKMRNEPARYYALRVGASQDALRYRKQHGLSMVSYEQRFQAQKMSLILLAMLVEDEAAGVQEVAMQFDRAVSQQPRDIIFDIRSTLRWYTRPLMREIGAESFASRIRALASCVHNESSQFRDMLYDWAFRLAPTAYILTGCPLGSLYWTHLFRRAAKKIT